MGVPGGGLEIQGWFGDSMGQGSGRAPAAVAKRQTPLRPQSQHQKATGTIPETLF